MENRGPVFEKSNSVENVYHLRLTALLRELVRDGGFKGAAQALDIDQRTVARSFRSGVLSRRVRTALERGLQEGEGSAAAVQRERNDGLEGRLKDAEDNGEELGKGLAAVRGDVKALRDEQAQGFRQVERRLTQVEGPGEDRGPVADDPAGGPAKPADGALAGVPRPGDQGGCRGRRGGLRRSLAAHRRVAGAEGRSPQPGRWP